MNENLAGLFGLANSNHDFSKKRTWGKNIFTNAFPIALTCYMGSVSKMPVYLTLNDEIDLEHSYISSDDVFGVKLDQNEAHFLFEGVYNPYLSLVSDELPRCDLIVSSNDTMSQVRPIEIKLTVVPDSATWQYSEEFFGTELVVRPDTIVYLALSIAENFYSRREELSFHLQSLHDINDWLDENELVDKIDQIRSSLNQLMLSNLALQQPLVLQPIWKTVGRDPILHKNAFDVFVWSDYGFTRLFFDDSVSSSNKLTRGGRSLIWLARMLYDFMVHGKVETNIKRILTFGAQSDKAFASNGQKTQKLMSCDELVRPRVRKDEVRNIILGSGQEFLSPERRLDAAIWFNIKSSETNE